MCAADSGWLQDEGQALISALCLTRISIPNLQNQQELLTCFFFPRSKLYLRQCFQSGEGGG